MYKLKCFICICLATLLSLNTSLAIGTGENILNYFKNATANELDFSTITSTLWNTFLWIGYAAAIILLLVTGIQFLVATPQKKAQLKDRLWLIFIGIIMLVATTSILNIFYAMGQKAAEAIS